MLARVGSRGRKRNAEWKQRKITEDDEDGDDENGDKEDGDEDNDDNDENDGDDDVGGGDEEGRRGAKGGGVGGVGVLRRRWEMERGVVVGRQRTDLPSLRMRATHRCFVHSLLPKFEPEPVHVRVSGSGSEQKRHSPAAV